MTLDTFWNIVEQARPDADLSVEEQQRVQYERLTVLLSALPQTELRDFSTHLSNRLHESYTARLWGAAYFINGGCSDDSFDYFRGWLIAQGRTVYEAALANPDSLAERENAKEDETHFEGFLSVAYQIHDKVSGHYGFEDMPTGDIPIIPLPDITDEDFDIWTNEDRDLDLAKTKVLYPRLYAKFGTAWENEDDDD